jgi:2-polyprenyl-3-methyl-5-hydroxy-6-metoxy-1,4-benzoquinol methylase
MSPASIDPARLALVDEHDYYAAMTQGSKAERAFHPRRVALLRGCVDCAGKQVLDVGSSTGPLTVPLLQDGVDVVAVDLSADHLARLEAYARQEGVTARTVQADAASLPFDDDAFDVVFLASVVHLVPDPSPILREAERVCRPGGRIVVAGPWSRHPKSNVLIKTILRGGKRPDGRQHAFDVPHLRRWLRRSTLLDRRMDWLMGYFATVWTPDRKPS